MMSINRGYPAGRRNLKQPLERMTSEERYIIERRIYGIAEAKRRKEQRDA